jgi:hypothetical protein
MGVRNNMTMKRTSVPGNFLRLAGLATALSLGAAVTQAQQIASSTQDDGPDPALANMAPADAAAAQQNVAPGQPDAQQNFSGPPPAQQTPAPIVRSAPMAQPADPAQYATPQPGQPDDSYNAPAPGPGDPQADAQVAAGQQALDDADFVSDQAPPDLPDYVQPEAPGDNYMWTPGYWGYGGADYYWVPGVWIVPPYYGALWTPGYWGWYGAKYRFHPGYWGPHVGYYGGINYGYGYIGTGYFGGYWRGNAFIYNRAVTNVGFRVSSGNVYNRTVIYNHQTFGARPTLRTSYNGGRGGIAVAPRPAELAAMHESHTSALPGQRTLRTNAAQNPQAAFGNNHGRPAMAVQQQPLGANRPIANNAAAFQQRPQNQTMQQNRPMNQQQRPQQQPRPQMQQPHSAPQPHMSAPAPHASPAPQASSGGGGKH